MPSNDNDPTSMMVVTLISALRAIVRDAVRDAVHDTTDAANSNATPIHTREFLTAEQLAQRLGVSTRSVHRMVRRDGLPSHTIGPKLVRFLWSEVELWGMARGKNLEGIAAREQQKHLRRVR